MTSKVFRYIGVGLTCMLLVGCGKYLSVGNVKYRVNGAQYAEMGGIGEKTQSFLQPKSYQHWSKISLQGLDMRVARETDRSKFSEKEIKGAIKALKYGEAEARVFRKSLEEGRYKLLTFVEPRKVFQRLRQLQADEADITPGERVTKPLEGGTGRVVTSVILVYGHNSNAEDVFEIGAKVKAIKDVDGEVTFQNKKKETVKIADNSIIAYELSYITVDKESSEPKRFRELKVDRIGVQ